MGNLMSFQRPATMIEVQQEMGNLTGIVASGDGLNMSTILNRKQELEGMKAQAEAKEQQAYQLLKVKNLRQLQFKVDTINKNLLTFSNAALSKMPIVKAAEGKTYQEIEDALFEQIQSEKIFDDLGIDFKSEMGRTAEDVVAEEFSEFVKKIRGISSTQAGAKLKQAAESRNWKKKGRFLKGYKKELEAFINMSKESTYEYKIDLTFTAPEDNATTNITYYPYAFLTPEQKAKAMNMSTLTDKQIWKQFKDQMAVCAGQYDYLVRRLMGDGVNSAFRVSDFFVENSAGIKGILGELQTAIIFSALTGQDATFFGNTMEDGKKVGVDIALENIGFQVKNYKIIQSDKWEGFSLGQTMTLSLFLSKLQQAGLSGDTVQDLKTFYTLKAYNIETTDDYASTASYIDSLGKKIHYWLQGYGTAFLPLGAYNVGEDLSISNVFYFVGGQRILPISYIIDAYIRYLDALLDQGMNKGGSVIDYTLKTSSIPQTYADYYKAMQEGGGDNVFVGYPAIASNLSMQYNMKLSLPSVTQIIQQQIGKI